MRGNLIVTKYFRVGIQFEHKSSLLLSLLIDCIANFVRRVYPKKHLGYAMNYYDGEGLAIISVVSKHKSYFVLV